MSEDWTILKENWATTQHAFVAYGPRILFCLVVLVGIYAIARLMKAWVASRRKPVPPNPDVQFLEGALDEDAPRKPNPNYSYAEFQRDLHDKGLTFDEIYEKCGGVFPKKPDENYPQGFQGPQGFIDFSQYGRSGFSGFSGYPSPSGHSGYPGSGYSGYPPSDRTMELQIWFKKQGERVPIKGVVPPPPAPHTIIHKIFTRGRR